MNNSELLTPAIETRFLEVVADEKTLKREASFALQAINKSEQLKNCSVESKQQALLNVANIGLSLNPTLNLAYLVPRWNGKTRSMECTLMPSYQGIIKLLTDSGSVTSCSAGVIREGDSYEYELGTDPFFKHRPKLGNKGQIIGAYAIAVLHNGTKQVEIIDENDIDNARGMSESYLAYMAQKIKSCVWIDHEAEMCRKTVVKRLAKYLPKTNQFEKAAKAIELDNEEYTLDPNSRKAEHILDVAGKVREGRQLDAIISEVRSGMSRERADKLMEQLMNDYDPMIHDANPSQTSIGKHVKEVAS